MEIIVRETTHKDYEDVLSILKTAFDNEKEAELVSSLLKDPSAKPSLSLIAFDGKKPVGHILFTKILIVEHEAEFSTQLLAPLAVIPDAQRKGVGKKLVETGLNILSTKGVDAVFVLGHPEYYPICGFKPAGCQGFEAPYPIPEEHADAWMVKALNNKDIEKISGKIVIADALDKPEYWRE